jgi:hypothetical protein
MSPTVVSEGRREEGSELEEEEEKELELELEESEGY